MLSNVKLKPGFLKDVIITFTLCPVFAAAAVVVALEEECVVE